MTIPPMRLLVAQINPTIGDFEGNLQKVLQAIVRGRREGVDLVICPELSLTGYPPQDFLLHPEFIEEAAACLPAIIQASADIAVIVGLPGKNTEGGEKGLFNSAAIISHGKLLGFQNKILLPTYDVFDERRYFEPGGAVRVWPLAGRRVGVTICEDIWQHSELLRYTAYTRDPVEELKPLRPDLVVNLSASPYNVGKETNRQSACVKAARTLNCPVILCNQVGGNDSLIFDGYSLFVGADGVLRNYAKGFEEELMTVDLASETPEKKFAFDPVEDLYRALVLGLRDYFKKSGFTRACLGLSGGIDSALVACLAAEALGPDNILAVLMPSRYSSQSSITDAYDLAATLGIETKEISIEKPFQVYLDLLTPHFEGKGIDATEENFQARTRGMILMALSNKHGHIVLSTGNKSELAMGYSTLYGDLCGGLAVIGDVTKGQVYALARRINRDKEVIPWNTIHKAPSAELRPDQKDSDSLPDYAIIDNVLQAYLEEHLSAEIIADRFEYPLALVQSLILRIHRNEYKRRQAPPCLRVSEKAFFIGRHFPIVQHYL